MSARPTRTPNANWISTTAALVALAGHALVLLVALLFQARANEMIVNQGVVSVTLVGSAGAAGGSTATASTAPTPGTNLEAVRTSSDLSGERLDQLLSSRTAPAPSSTSLPSRPSPTTASAPSTGGPNAPSSMGSSSADGGLGAGEGAAGVDLYAAAALPDVGTRPASPSGSDLWSRVAPCWREASSRTATLLVDLRADGRLNAPPMAVRRAGGPADPQTLLAERAAVRAVQACAPYEGLKGKKWRVVFGR